MTVSILAAVSAVSAALRAGLWRLGRALAPSSGGVEAASLLAVLAAGPRIHGELVLPARVLVAADARQARRQGPGRPGRR